MIPGTAELKLPHFLTLLDQPIYDGKILSGLFSFSGPQTVKPMVLNLI
jgi:hypothetical protein